MSTTKMPGANDTVKVSMANQQTMSEGKTIWSRVYGLPSWMRVPIDRLNIKTDFEEYASSPPEVESGFVPEFESKIMPEPVSPPPIIQQQQQPTLKTSRSAPMLTDKTLTLTTQRQVSADFLKEVAIREGVKMVKPGALPQQLQLSIPSNLTSSSATPSAENTPNSTPQGSPYITRKGNRAVFDESPCSNNPKKWFYTGLFEKSNEMSKTGSLPSALNENVASKCAIADTKTAVRDEKKTRKVTSLPSPGYKKYTVSNFDLNAVSPTSW